MGKKEKKMAVAILINAILSFLLLKSQQKCINRWRALSEKNRGLFILMDQWVNLKQESKCLEKYFTKKNYRKIAIYGMSYVGLRLVKELKNSEIEVAYGIDKNADLIYSEIKLVTINSMLSAVDAVVVTVIDEFEEVNDKLALKLTCPILSIEDILNEI